MAPVAIYSSPLEYISGGKKKEEGGGLPPRPLSPRRTLRLTPPIIPRLPRAWRLQSLSRHRVYGRPRSASCQSTNYSSCTTARTSPPPPRLSFSFRESNGYISLVSYATIDLGPLPESNERPGTRDERACIFSCGVLACTAGPVKVLSFVSRFRVVCRVVRSREEVMPGALLSLIFRPAPVFLE